MTTSEMMPWISTYSQTKQPDLPFTPLLQVLTQVNEFEECIHNLNFSGCNTCLSTIELILKNVNTDSDRQLVVLSFIEHFFFNEFSQVCRSIKLLDYNKLVSLLQLNEMDESSLLFKVLALMESLTYLNECLAFGEEMMGSFFKNGKFIEVFLLGELLCWISDRNESFSFRSSSGAGGNGQLQRIKNVMNESKQRFSAEVTETRGKDLGQRYEMILKLINLMLKQTDLNNISSTFYRILERVSKSEVERSVTTEIMKVSFLLFGTQKVNENFTILDQRTRLSLVKVFLRIPF